MVIMKVITGVEVRSYWSRVGPYSTITAVTVETTQCGETNTHLGRRPCEDEGRDWGDMSTSLKAPGAGRCKKSPLLESL